MFYILEEAIGDSKIAILRCSEDAYNPVWQLDEMLWKYGGHVPCNIFFDANFNLPYQRIVIKNINGLDWQELEGTEKQLYIYEMPEELSEKSKIRFTAFCSRYRDDDSLNELRKVINGFIEKNADKTLKRFRHIRMDDLSVQLLVESVEDSEFDDFTTQKI